MTINGGIRIGGIAISGYDADAVAYFDRAGVTDNTAKVQINGFVMGMKDLSLYNSMVCWPLRSSQNSGTGTTAYSLGGLGIYDGTLGDSPAWGTNGITFNGTSQYITTTYSPPAGSLAFISVFNSSTESALRCLGGNLSNINTRGFRLRDDAALFGDGSLQSSVRDFFTLGSFVMASALYNRPSDAYTFKNESEGTIPFGNAALAGTNNLALFVANDGGFAQHFSGQGAFSMIIPTAVTPSQYLSIYSLYKTTMGTGLGLP